MDRRQFLTTSSLATLGLNASPAPHPKGKAEHCIMIWLGGGMSQIDTFDPKIEGSSKKPFVTGSDYPSIETSVKGVKVCEHLPQLARRMEQVTAVRSCHHNLIDEHAIASNFVHTGRPTSGSTTYPSIGSIVAHQRGAANPSVPAYMLIGFPNVSRGPGFLGANYGNIYLTDMKTGPAGFTRPEHFNADRIASRKNLLDALKKDIPAGSPLADYQKAQTEALRLAGPGFMKNFNLDSEPADLRNKYRSEFGQRCLLARRLVQDGVRFIELSHNPGFLNGTGWDTHGKGQLKQHELIRDLDNGIATLMDDLKKKDLLDKTLIVIATEFGRPPEFDGNGGRGHQGSAFSLVLAGGGLKHRGAFGRTDELSKKVVENPVSIPDFHATIHTALGIDPAHELITDGSRPVPITDRGTLIASLF
ncbi:MAG: DUF1501 domain-containing protein [Akkermansiaceae bacterium]|jgi:hypothetical protein|nr:DUF1501 domain-containing protein [Akkermansiaceae bacterium]